MTKKAVYDDRIKNSGNQTVEAPFKTKPVKKPVVKQGGDLRAKTSKSN